MITTAVRTSLSPIYTNLTNISFKITLKCIQNDIFVVFIMSTHTHNDGHESKPAISILAIVQESRKTSAFRYFSSYSFYFIT